MKRYEVWLNGKIINDYVRHGDALNKCFKLISKHGLNPTDDSLYVYDSENGNVIAEVL